jgi:transcription elongation GreA/GreB family factor
MPATELLELAKRGDFDHIETRCLELLDSKTVVLADLLPPFHQLEKAGIPERLASLTQIVLENVDTTRDAASALELARVALNATPDSAELRTLVLDLYPKVHGGTPGFAAILATSGLAGGRPARLALKLLDVCLTLAVGDALISRLDDRVVEVSEIDRENGLFTLRREGRATTLPATEVARDYDRLSADDFRVLRQLRPDRLREMIQNDPVAVVIGLLHSHGESISVDILKDELVPRYIPAADWARWWSKARTALKRSPNVTIEGRAPVILSYNAQGRTFEDETWEAFESRSDPVHWLGALESYCREKSARKEAPDRALLERCGAHVARYIESIRWKRPGEAFGCALVLETLETHGLPAETRTRELPVALVRESKDPAGLIASLEHEAIWARALAVLKEARPEDWTDHAVALLPRTRAALLDTLVEELSGAGRAEDVKHFVDAGLERIEYHAELVYYLWKGPKHAAALRIPPPVEQFTQILKSLSGLGRDSGVPAEVAKEFRARVKSALALRDYAQVRACLEMTSPEQAITIRRQLERLEGLGENARARLLDLLRDAHPHLWAQSRTIAAPWEDEETIWCTNEGLMKKTAERDQLVNVEMRANARRIGEAASLGDLSENSEYRFALEERDLLRARLARMNDDLSRARTLSPGDVPTEHVGVGSRVRLRDTATGEEHVMTFLGPFETDVERRVYSYLAPFSQKLMGRTVGERPRAPFHGRETELEVLAIENALARDVHGGAMGGS